ncbi:MAG: peptide-methionine (S)-S-oxide reductase MsrA, partial [Cytophagaceae bacterium]
MEKITLGAGCFWCVEAVFQNLKGVESVVSGYSGGEVKNPSYKQVVTGSTGHAEVVQISYEPSEISFQEILEVFFETHDPTTLNRQGADEGTQYRSAIFYHSEEQRKIAEEIITELNQAKVFEAPVVTEVSPF